MASVTKEMLDRALCSFACPFCGGRIISYVMGDFERFDGTFENMFHGRCCSCKKACITVGHLNETPEVIATRLVGYYVQERDRAVMYELSNEV